TTNQTALTGSPRTRASMANAITPAATTTSHPSARSIRPYSVVWVRDDLRGIDEAGARPAAAAIARTAPEGGGLRGALLHAPAALVQRREFLARLQLANVAGLAVQPGCRVRVAHDALAMQRGSGELGASVRLPPVTRLLGERIATSGILRHAASREVG